MKRRPFRITVALEIPPLEFNRSMSASLLSPVDGPRPQSLMDLIPVLATVAFHSEDMTEEVVDSASRAARRVITVDDVLSHVMMERANQTYVCCTARCGTYPAACHACCRDAALVYFHVQPAAPRE